MGDGSGSGKESEWDGQDLVARPDVIGHQRQSQGIGTGRASDGVPCPAVRGHGRFELPDGLAQDQFLGLTDLCDCGHCRFADLVELGTQIEEGYPPLGDR